LTVEQAARKATELTGNVTDRDKAARKATHSQSKSELHKK
jgi:hypothetical protein